MIIPVRCFTCGTVVGSGYETYMAAVAKGTPSKEALNSTGLERFCCRRMIVAHVDLLPDAAAFE